MVHEATRMLLNGRPTSHGNFVRQWGASHCLPIQQPSSDPRTSPRRRDPPGQPEPLGCRLPSKRPRGLPGSRPPRRGAHRRPPPTVQPWYLLDEKLTPLVLLLLTPEHLRHVLLVDCNVCPRLPVQVLHAGQGPLHPPHQRCLCASRKSSLARRPSSIATSTSPATCSSTHRASRTLNGPWQLMLSGWSVAVRVARNKSGYATGPASLPSGRPPSYAQKRNQAPQSSDEACQRRRQEPAHSGQATARTPPWSPGSTSGFRRTCTSRLQGEPPLAMALQSSRPKCFVQRAEHLSIGVAIGGVTIRLSLQTNFTRSAPRLHNLRLAGDRIRRRSHCDRLILRESFHGWPKFMIQPGSGFLESFLVG